MTIEICPDCGSRMAALRPKAWFGSCPWTTYMKADRGWRGAAFGWPWQKRRD